MTKRPPAKFQVGEIAILQPPHPSARAYWGMETQILRAQWDSNSIDAFSESRSGWSYETDIPAPPPTQRPEHLKMRWIWCEYDLRKKYDPGTDIKSLIEELNSPLVIVASRV